MRVKREIQEELLSLLKQYPVVTVTGPRQSGKTTLVRSACPGMVYYTLEDPDTREAALADPRAFLGRNPGGVVLDEIQRAPELLSYIQGIADQTRKNGLFVLTGSQQFEVLNRVSQSLAGRTALLRLLPFTLAEAQRFRKRMSVDDWLLHGFYPRIYDQKLNPNKAYRNYFETYVERDLRQLIQVKDLHLFQKFIRLCAGRTGQLLNVSSLSNDVGVSVFAVNAWLSILQASYVVFLLEPYFENVGKRLIKAPKLYFYDVGLAAYLLGVEDKSQLERHPLRGNLFENLVVQELVKDRYNRGLDHNLQFFRDSNGNEIDVVYKSGASLVPVEIKAAQTFVPDFLKGLRYLHKVFPKTAESGYVVYAGNREYAVDGFRVVHFNKARHILTARTPPGAAS